jgi:hypothetical protein
MDDIPPLLTAFELTHRPTTSNHLVLSPAVARIMSTELPSSLRTPCGLVFSNRLVKAAMAESMADADNNPGDKYITAYNTWSDGGWGAMLTGPYPTHLKTLTSQLLSSHRLS